MPKAVLPINEQDRLRALEQCCVFDTPPEKAFDDLTRLAAKLCGVPIAIVSLVDSERQWFKSVVGLDVNETPRDFAICAHAILCTGPLVIADATLDARTSDNPLVTGMPQIRFYAGIPLRTSDGFNVGTLCVIDTVPRELSAEQLEDLNTLAGQVSAQLELRRANQKLVEEKQALIASNERLVQIAAQLPGVVYQFQLRPDGTSCFPYASDGIRAIYRLAPEDVQSDASKVFAIIHPDDIDEVSASIEESARTLEPWQREYRVQFPDGVIRWLYGNAKPTRRPDNSVLWHGFVTDVTQQRTERDELQRVRSQLEAVIDASTQVAIIATDLNGLITVFNSGAEKMLGYSAAEMEGLQTPQQIHLESEVQARGEQLTRETGREIRGFNAFVEYARQGRHDTREWTYIRKDGTHLTVQLNVTSIRDADNTLVGFVGVAMDVTAAKKAERELVAERERLDLALSGSQLGTWEWDIQTGKIRSDERWAAIVGERTQPEYSSEEWASCIHPDDLPIVMQKAEDHFSGRTTKFDADVRRRNEDGTWRWVAARGRIVERDRRGRPLRMVGTIADITEQVLAKEALEASESRFSQLAAFAPIGIFQADLQGHCLYTNARWEEISGVSSSESLGDRWMQGIHPDDQSTVAAAWQKLIALGGDFDMEFRWVRPDGEVRYLRSFARPVMSVDQVRIGFVGCNKDITERKLAEIELRSQNAWFKALTDSMPHLTWTTTASGACDHVSKQWTAYTGVSEQVQLGTGWLQQVHPADRDSLAELCQHHFTTGLPIEARFRIRRADGIYRWFHSHGVPIRDSLGRIVKWLGSGTDIQDIITSEERYELAVRGSSAGLWDWDLHTDAVYYSNRFKEILGYSEGDFWETATSFHNAVHPDDRSAVKKAVDVHFANPKTPFDCEHRLRTKSNDYRFVHNHGIAVFDDDGNPCRMVGSIVDITDQRYAQLELKSTSELLRHCIRNTPAAVAMLDTEMRYLQVSERWLQDYQLQQDEIIGKSHYDVFVDLPERWKEVHRRVLAGATESCKEDPFDRADGTTEWLQWEAHPWRNSKNQIGGLIFFTQFITQRKRAERELISAREFAEAANRSKSDFLANMSHEIRTPLTSILGYADLLNDRSLSTIDRDSHIATIKNSGSHLLKIINDVLDLSKIEAGKMEIEETPFSPAEITEEVLSYFRGAASAKGITLTAVAASSVPRTICSDPVRVRQILVNLVGNAVKFTECGSINVAFRMMHSDESPTPLMAFDVRDTGIGISSEHRAKLFAPFTQADNSTTRRFGGTGLGLTICRRMAQLLGGDICFTSEVGQGSTFTATIRARPVDEFVLVNSLRSDETRLVTQINPGRLTGSILVAEDSPVNQHLIRTLLTKAGALVDVVENGKRAVEKAMRGPDRRSVDSSGSIVESYSLIIMDMQMPVMDGCTATQKLRSLGFLAPIVVLTASAMDEDRQRCLTAGCNDVVTKPIDFSRFIKTCGDWMTQHRATLRSDCRTNEAIRERPPFDRSALFRLIDRMVDLLENVVRLFIEDSSTLMNRAKTALSEGNAGQLAHAAHRLMGSIGVVHAGPAFGAAQQLGRFARQEDLVGAATQIEELQDELNLLYPALSNLVNWAENSLCCLS